MVRRATRCLGCWGAFDKTGGLLIAVGSAGMAEIPSASSTQHSVVHIFSSIQAGVAIVHIQDGDGCLAAAFEPAKAYQSMLVPSPELESGATYTGHLAGGSTLGPAMAYTRVDRTRRALRSRASRFEASQRAQGQYWLY